MTEAVDSNLGYYGIYHLASARETDRRKAHVGIFHWGKTKIMALVKRGEFPAPMKNLGQANVWAKEVIHRYVEFIKQGKTLSEAAAAAQGV